jgi:hypothetical protein
MQEDTIQAKRDAKPATCSYSGMDYFALAVDIGLESDHAANNGKQS